jgi:type II secretory pathway predicted ATPase ExeA
MAVSRAEVLPVGPPVSPEWQIGREGDIARLSAAVAQGDHTVLADERRTGKTTVALAALELLAADAMNVIVAVDLSRAMNDGKALDEAVAVQIAAQRSVFARGAWQAGNLALRLWNLVRGAGLVEGDEGQAIEAIVQEMRAGAERGDRGWALDAAVALVEEKGGRVVVFVDEAQQLDGWNDREEVAAELLARMREPEAPVTFLFAGSEPSLVRTLFAKGGLLEFDAHDFPLSPIDPQPWREGLRRAFRALDAEITTRAVDRILEATDGHPHRTMLVANRAHEEMEFARETVVDEALADVAVRTAKESRLWEPRQ